MQRRISSRRFDVSWTDWRVRLLRIQAVAPRFSKETLRVTHATVAEIAASASSISAGFRERGKVALRWGHSLWIRGGASRVDGSFMRRTLRETGWKPVFHDRLEAYPTPPSRCYPVSSTQAFLCPAVLCHSSSVSSSACSAPPRFTSFSSRWRGTGWKPVFHDRLEAYLTFLLCVFLCVLCASAFRFLTSPSPPAIFPAFGWRWCGSGRFR